MCLGSFSSFFFYLSFSTRAKATGGIFSDRNPSHTERKEPKQQYSFSMVALEEKTVVYVAIELIALVLLAMLSYRCCRRSMRRAREEGEAAALPVVSRPKHARANANGADTDDEMLASHDSGRSVSGRLWRFLSGVREPRRTDPSANANRDTSASSANDGRNMGDVEMVILPTAVDAAPSRAAKLSGDDGGGGVSGSAA